MDGKVLVVSELREAMEEAIARLGDNPMYGTIRALDIQMHKDPNDLGRDGVKSVLPPNVGLDAGKGENDLWESTTSINNLMMVSYHQDGTEQVLYRINCGQPVQTAAIVL